MLIREDTLNQITTGFCLHRPEMAPVNANAMEQHEIVFLEEPPAPGFTDMLETRLDMDESLMSMDIENLYIGKVDFLRY